MFRSFFAGSQVNCMGEYTRVYTARQEALRSGVACENLAKRNGLRRADGIAKCCNRQGWYRSALRAHLSRVLSDSKPISYTYSDAAHVLTALGFEVAPHSGGSHRKWRCKLPDGNVVIVGLVEKGNGTLKPYFIHDMMSQLVSNGLVPKDLE